MALAIDAPYPRDAAFRSSPRYGQWCLQLSQALAAGHEAGPGAPS